MLRIAIIGAGASGLAAASELLKYPELFFIQLFERNAKIAKKVAATGNGHCNLSNAQMDIHAYQGDIAGIFDQIKAFDIEAFCMELGFLTRRNGSLYYPYSFQAHTVTKAFERRIEQGNIQLFLNTQIIEINRQQNIYHLKDQNGRHFKADMVIMAGGGKASPVFGSDGSCLEMLARMKIKIAPLYPSLVQVKTMPALKKLKGCRFYGTFSLYKNGSVIASNQGEALLTEDGLSGIAIMQLSRLLRFDSETTYEIDCNLIDHLDKQQLSGYYAAYKNDKNVYAGIVQEKIANYLNLQPTSNYESFIQRLSHFRFKVYGTRGFEFAQVTRGGVLLSELDQCLMSKKYPNLYVCGEMLNIDGDCGGYNLHFAFASGKIVAKAIIKQMI